MPRARKPWTKATLLKHLLNLLDRPTTTLKLAALRNGYAGECEFDDHFPPAWVRIRIDANANDNIKFVMHELIHVVISEIVLGKFDPTLEEAFLLGLENFLWDHISKSKRAKARWQALIDKKLAETAVKEPEAPLAELVVRPPEK